MMDFGDTLYVSCIKIGDQPIIPPLLTDELRSEMRYFRDLAVTIEKRRKQKRHSTDSGVMISSMDRSLHKNQETLSESIQSNNLGCNTDDNQNKYVSTVQSTNDGILTENEKDECLTVPSDKQRRNSYTLENPSPILIDYISRKSDKKWELFVDSKKEENTCSNYSNVLPENILCMENHCNETIKKTEQLTLKDLETDLTETESSNSMNEELWNFHDQDELRNLNLNPLSTFSEQKMNSLPSSARASPVSVIRAYESTECLKYDSNFFSSNMKSDVSDQSGETTPLRNDSWQDGHNDGSNIGFDINESTQEFNLSVETFFEKDISDQFINDSFSKDFLLIDSNASMNVSHEFDAYQEGRCSDCSSVSLSKFLSQDKKLLDGQEAEYTAFSYMKEQLESKHRIQLALLLKQQQKEHDSLKIQFSRITSLSKNTPSPKSSYAYSQDVVLKKYSPCGKDGCTPPYRKLVENEEIALNGQSTPQKTTKCDEFRSNDNLHEETTENNVNKKMKAATKINAAVRGFLTRRLFRTDRVTLLVQTIKDCLLTAVSLQNEVNLGLSELDLQSRLLQQLTVACNELNDIFLLPIDKRMAIISADREKKNRLLWRKCTTPLPLSEATKRSLERRNIIAKSAPPGQRKYWRKHCRSASSTTSESNSCRSTPGYRRPISNAIMSQKFSVSQCARRPWR